MHLTRYSDYSLRVLMYLGVKDERFATIEEIATRYCISRNHLTKVVHGLSQANYIHTERGRTGGIYLRDAPERINLGTLIRTIENGFPLVECLGADNRCAITPACRLRRILGDALQAFFAELDRHTLADLLTNKAEMRELLGIETLPVGGGAPQHASA